MPPVTSSHGAATAASSAPAFGASTRASTSAVATLPSKTPPKSMTAARVANAPGTFVSVTVMGLVLNARKVTLRPPGTATMGSSSSVTLIDGGDSAFNATRTSTVTSAKSIEKLIM